MKILQREKCMMNISEKRNILSDFILIWVVIGVILWIICVLVGYPNFNSDNAISIYGTMVQGMSALLSVSIAVIVFRVQSLENRLQSLEQFILDYIFKISTYAYAYWIPRVEKHIRDGIIVKKYYTNRKELTEEIQKEIKENKDPQQKSLMKALSVHESIKETIHKTKYGGYQSFILLTVPILLSFYLLMLSDGMVDWLSFINISLVILLSIFGILSLIKTVIDSLGVK